MNARDTRIRPKLQNSIGILENWRTKCVPVELYVPYGILSKFPQSSEVILEKF